MITHNPHKHEERQTELSDAVTKLKATTLKIPRASIADLEQKNDEPTEKLKRCELTLSWYMTDLNASLWYNGHMALEYFKRETDEV